MRDRVSVAVSSSNSAAWAAVLAAVLAGSAGSAGTAGCSGGDNGTSAETSTTAAVMASGTGGASSTGGSAGAPTTGAASSGEGSSTGAFVDGGCNHLGDVDAGGACVLDIDCACPFECVASVCQIVCTRDSDCPPANACFDGGMCGFYCRVDAECPMGDICVDGGVCIVAPMVCAHSTDCPPGNECTDAGVCEPISGFCDPDGGVDQFQTCGQNSDCFCPYDCFADILRGAVCEKPCASVADCFEADEICEGDAGACQRTADCYGGDGGVPELGGCGASIQCACPLGCFDGLCEPACTVASDCGPVGDAGQYCEGDAGFCLPIPVCNPAAGSTEFLGCVQTTDCLCPFECVVDPRRGAVCELACTDGSDCTGDEICEGDAGACQRTSSCFGGDAGIPEWNGCTATIQCACPLTCIIDPSFSTAAGTLLCEQCDAGTSCEAPAGGCVDAGALLAASQIGPDTSLWVGCGVDSENCDCPNQCLPIAGGASWACQLPPPSCSSNADCPDPTTFCVSGGCIPNICPSGAVVTQPCDVAFGQDNPPLTGDGECLPDFLGGPTLICVEGGTANVGGSCDLPADRNDPGNLCPSGSTCIAGDGINFCAVVCQIGALPDCDGGDGSSLGNCSALNPAYANSCPTCTPPLYAPQACLPGQVACTSDLPTYQSPDGPFDSIDVGIPFAPCTTTDCLCPATCVYDFFLSQLSNDDAGTFCESSCGTDSDCPWPQTNCNGGSCAMDRADCATAIPGGVASNLGAECSSGTAKGTCVYFSPFVLQPEPASIFTASTIALCRINGTAKGSCDPNAKRGSSQLCGAGTDCLPLPDGGHGCLSICDPLSDAGSCAAGQACVPASRLADGIDEGVCVDLGDGGCAAGLFANEFAPCRTGADCACGLSCVPDPNLPVGAQWTKSTTFCERSCTAVTDCPLDEYCFGEAGNRTCRLNLCADASPVAPTCNADDTGSGTCLAQGPDLAYLPFMPATPASALFDFGLCGSEPALSCIPGLCLQGGTATGACDPNADRSTPDLLCVPGAICDTSGPTPMCTSLCTLPNSAGLCPDGEVCRPLPGAATVPGAGNLQGDCLPAMGLDAGT